MDATPIENHITELFHRLSDLTARDRQRIHHELSRIRAKVASEKYAAAAERALKQIEQRIQSCAHSCDQRRHYVPSLSYNETLPIFTKKNEIIDAIQKHPVLIISGETGSGKTTQIPKFCLAAGRGVQGKIGCTQPRRIAAITVCERIAEELGEEPGTSVGYKIRFRENTGEHTYIKMMTDGILLAEAQRDPYLIEYDTIVVDEAHERSLNIDFVLGILNILLRKRHDLKVIITSATIDTEKFSKAFNRAPVIEVSGRLYPVDTLYAADIPQSEEDEDRTHVEMAVDVFDSLKQKGLSGDVLIFMPTEQDILETIEILQGRRYSNITPIPLYARLPSRDQARIFLPLPGRKVIVATNVAETSITIPGIKYVIDTGLARISRYSPRTRTTSLPVVPISQSSADQRKGRCGRVQNGVCVRLFSEEDFQSRPLYTPPEILRANLSEVILRMIALHLGEVSNFPFIDPPVSKSIQDGCDLLFELGALTHPPACGLSKRRNPLRLTQTGRLMARMPIDPRLSRMMIQAKNENCLGEIVVISAALSIQDPRQRPADRSEAADRIHERFIHSSSDFMTLLNIWNQYHMVWQVEKTAGKMKKYCEAHFLSYRRMREWRDIFSQISGILEDCGMTKTRLNANCGRGGDSCGLVSDDRYAAIHRSILSGFLSNIATKKEKNIFKATKGREIMIFPGSGLFNRAGSWIVAAEIVETTRPFARTAANIDSTWIEDVGKGLCTYHYFDPHWEKDREAVAAFEQVNLFGLPIISKRLVTYGRVNPGEASLIFIQEALVKSHLRKPFPFMVHNRKLIDDIVNMENRLRRRDLLVSEDEIVQWYARRLQDIYDVHGLRNRLKQEGNDQFLRMTRDDLLNYSPDENDLSLFPDTIQLGQRHFPCVYRFEPARNKDGVTIEIPRDIAPLVPLEATEWIVPGLYKDRIAALIKALPKAFRKKLLPVSRSTEIIVREMPKTDDALFPTLSRFIEKRFNVRIPVSTWSEMSLPDHLSMRIALTGSKGEELHADRNKRRLQEQALRNAAPEKCDEIQSAKTQWEKSGIRAWEFETIPEQIHVAGKDHAGWTLYPGLKKTGEETSKAGSVELRLFWNKDDADQSHPDGVVVLFTNYFATDLKFLRKQLRLSESLQKPADYFGGADRVEKRLLDSVTRDLFQKNIRTEKDFLAHAEAVSSKLFSYGKKKLSNVMNILETYYECRSVLFILEQSNRETAYFMDFLAHLRSELNRLIPENFMDMYAPEKLPYLEKYIHAIKIRAQRGILNFDKERIRSADLKAYTDRLNDLVAGLDMSTSDEKRRAVEELFWLIEEYKVSLFAQELKTSVTVSKKRLESKIKHIEKMI